MVAGPQRMPFEPHRSASCRLDTPPSFEQSSLAPRSGARGRSTEMAAILIGNWWALALRGVAAILFAVIAFVWPEITAAALILLFGVYALIDGIFALIAGLRAAQHHGRSTALLVEGVLNIII